MGGQLDGIFLAGSLPHELILSLSLLFVANKFDLIWSKIIDAADEMTNKTALNEIARSRCG